jgi:type 1 fimbria pilin
MQLIAVLLSTAAPPLAMSSEGRIAFVGAVVVSTCTVSVDGPSTAESSVTLPAVGTVAVTATSGQSIPVGGTYFQMTLRGCGSAAYRQTGPSLATRVGIYFEAGANVDALTGGLVNAAASNGIEVKIYNASQSLLIGSQVMPGSPVNQPTPVALSQVGGALTQTQWFYAGYTANQAAAAVTAGPVSTSILYTLVYN